MSLRITQNQMYSSFNTRMNTNLSAMMESHLQSSSQLRINRPSDDPAGIGKALSHKNTLEQLGRYDSNIKTAMGWLSQADAVLASEGSVFVLLTRMKELAEQGSSETYDGNNRLQIGEELRQDFMQLINLANTKFNNQHIFAGHKTDQPAFELGLGVSSHNEDFNTALSDTGSYVVAEGAVDKTVVYQFLEDGPLDGARFRYSNDGGNTWLEGTAEVNGTDIVLDADKAGVLMTIRNAAGQNIQVQAVDTENPNETDNGTWLYARPTAVYKGDYNNVEVTTPYNNGNTMFSASSEGAFGRDVAVRIDSVDGNTVTYSFSTDDGSNWTQGTTSLKPGDPLGTPPTDLICKIPVPGGYLTLNGGIGATAADLAVGEQYVIHPYRADINYDISDTDSITVNVVGMDIFGGVYKPPFGRDYIPARPDDGNPNEGDASNLFEVLGRLVAAAETNSPHHMAEALEELKTAMNVVAAKAAVVGGRENRLEVTYNALAMRKLDEQEQLSNAEDVDVTELMTRLARQQVAYNSVLKSSSMIMQMSLVNFL